MEDARRRATEPLALPEEPEEARAASRALIEDDPEEGLRHVNAGQPLADILWEEWGAELEGAGMNRERFQVVTCGYADEIRLWVVGERPWQHCAAGLRGRLLRRLPRKESLQNREPELASCRNGEGR